MFFFVFFLNVGHKKTVSFKYVVVSFKFTINIPISFCLIFCHFAGKVGVC